MSFLKRNLDSDKDIIPYNKRKNLWRNQNEFIPIFDMLIERELYRKQLYNDILDKIEIQLKVNTHSSQSINSNNDINNNINNNDNNNTTDNNNDNNNTTDNNNNNNNNTTDNNNNNIHRFRSQSVENFLMRFIFNKNI